MTPIEPLNPDSAGHAVAEAVKRYEDAPEDLSVKQRLIGLLDEWPCSSHAGMRPTLERLILDPMVAPKRVSTAGWHFLLRHSSLLGPEAGFGAMAARIESDPLACSLLAEDIVTLQAVEQPLTALRRWLLVSGQWREHPVAIRAFAAQTVANGGAWPFDMEERAMLETSPDAAIVQAYRPRPRHAAVSRFSNPVTQKVAAQYEGWPYPQWKRVGWRPPTTFADEIRRLDPDGPDIQASPHILIAGCGTGQQVAMARMRYPDARVTAIDISAASLAFARQRFDEIGLDQVSLVQMDLIDVGRLNQMFDCILCSGVLHHLPDKDKGWSSLVDVLKPGGMMRIMVYSKRARMEILRWRARLSDLSDRAINDDLLREVRLRILADPASGTNPSRDFFSLAGVRDLFFPGHEDAFDITDIESMIAGFGLSFLGFDFHRRTSRIRYANENPHDPLRRDFDAWRAFERTHSHIFAGMYLFSCRKPI